MSLHTLIYYFIYMHVCVLAYLYVYQVHEVPMEARRGHRLPRAGATGEPFLKPTSDAFSSQHGVLGTECRC